MNKILIQITIMLLMVNISMGQNQSKEDKFKAQKVAFITQKLDLSPEEASKFWPVYNQMETELKKSRENKKMMKSEADMTNADANEFINEVLRTKEQELNIEKKYIEQFKTTLPIQKVAKLLIIERDFRKEVVSNVKERMKERRSRG